MDKLKENSPSSGMDGIDNAPPSLDLGSCVDLGHIWKPSILDTDGGRFRDDQSGGGALCVILRVHGSGYPVAVCTHAGQWRHDNPVRQLGRTESDGCK